MQTRALLKEGNASCKNKTKLPYEAVRNEADPHSRMPNAESREFIGTNQIRKWQPKLFRKR